LARVDSVSGQNTQELPRNQWLNGVSEPEGCGAWPVFTLFLIMVKEIREANRTNCSKLRI